MDQHSRSPLSPSPRPESAERGPGSERPAIGERLEGWLRARRRPVLLILVALSCALHLAYYASLQSGPFIDAHRWPDTDMSFFHQWGRGIAAGDWLSERTLHPFHDWHQLVSRIHFAAHPDALAELLSTSGAGRVATPSAADLDRAGRELWNRWYGGQRFHQAPLYPYLIGLTYRLLGDDPRWVFLWQSLLGVGMLALIHRITQRHFGDLAALAAAGLALLSAPLILYDLVLLRTSAITFAGLALVDLIDSSFARGSTRRRWLALGAAAGLATCLKATFLLPALGVIAALAYRAVRDPERRRECLRFGAALCLGLGIALAPPVARNLALDLPALSLSSVGAVTFVNTNYAEFDPAVGSQIFPQVTAQIMAASGGNMATAALLTLRTHSGLTSYARQLLAKMRWVLHPYEVPNNLNFYLIRSDSLLLRCLPVSFSVVASLALVGILQSARRRRLPLSLAFLCLCSLPSLVLFYVVSRYRVPLLALLLPFAGAAISNLLHSVGLRAYREIAAAALILLAAAPLTFASLPPDRVEISGAYYNAIYRYHYLPRIERARERSDFARAEDLSREFVRFEPPELQRALKNRYFRTRELAQIAAVFAAAHERRGEVLADHGERARAAEERVRARELRALLE